MALQVGLLNMPQSAMRLVCGSAYFVPTSREAYICPLKVHAHGCYFPTKALPAVQRVVESHSGPESTRSNLYHCRPVCALHQITPLRRVLLLCWARRNYKMPTCQHSTTEYTRTIYRGSLTTALHCSNGINQFYYRSQCNSPPCTHRRRWLGRVSRCRGIEATGSPCRGKDALHNLI